MPDNTLDLSAFEGHTPGPWALLNGWPTIVTIADDEAKYNGFAIDPAQQKYYAKRIHDQRDGYSLTGEEAVANSRLIAAAPDLLAEVLRLRALLASPRSPSGQPSEKPVIPASAILRDSMSGKPSKTRRIFVDEAGWTCSVECLFVRADAVSVQEGA